MSGFNELSLDPATSLPRSNGELVFAAPWESRAFGLAAALADQAVFSWKDFQASLIEAIGEHDRAATPDQPYRYYERWLAALEALAVRRGLVTPHEVEDRAAEYLCRPRGHDHDHDHDHDHGH